MLNQPDVMRMLQRNANYNDYLGSTNGAGYIGGCMHCGCGSGYIGGCMHCGCGSGYIGGFKDERKIRAMIREQNQRGQLNKTGYKKLLKEELEGYLLNNEPAKYEQYLRDSQNRTAAAKRRAAEYKRLYALEDADPANAGLSVARLRQIVRSKYPKKARKAGKGCFGPGLAARKGLQAYCLFRSQHPGMSRAALSELWKREKSVHLGATKRELMAEFPQFEF